MPERECACPAWLRRGVAATLATWALHAGAPASGRAQQPLVDVRVLPSDTLRDVALTIIGRGRATIYYNPDLVAHVGPRLARFFIAHEYGHVARGHQRGALAAGDSAFPAFREAQELEADCYAATRLGRSEPAVAEAAVRFFRQMGSFRFDNLHPASHRRAEKILACASGTAQAPPVEPLEGARSSPVPFTLRAPEQLLSGYGWEAQVWLDDVPVGMISSLRLAAGRVTVRGFAPGVHRYHLVVRLFALDRGMQLTPVGAAMGEGTIVVRGGEVFALWWAPGRRPVLHPGAR